MPSRGSSGPASGGGSLTVVSTGRKGWAGAAHLPNLGGLEGHGAVPGRLAPGPRVMGAGDGGLEHPGCGLCLGRVPPPRGPARLPHTVRCREREQGVVSGRVLRLSPAGLARPRLHVVILCVHNVEGLHPCSCRHMWHFERTPWGPVWPSPVPPRALGALLMKRIVVGSRLPSM